MVLFNLDDKIYKIVNVYNDRNGGGRVANYINIDDADDDWVNTFSILNIKIENGGYNVYCKPFDEKDSLILRELLMSIFILGK